MLWGFHRERNIIHRDLKPNNILFLDKEKTHVVIIDFGISGFSNGNNRERIKAGTTMFLAPETACGNEFGSNRKLDIWALGIILYRMIEGVYPFDGKNSKEILNNIMKKKLEFNKKIKVSLHLKKLIEGMLEKNHRFRIDDDSELFKNWFEFTPARKNSTIVINKISKDPIFDNSNKDNENEKELRSKNDYLSICEEIKKENSRSSLSNIFRGRSLKNTNKFKLYLNINNDKKAERQSEIGDIANSEINKKNTDKLIFKSINSNSNVNIISSPNNQEIEKNNNKNKQLILPAFSYINVRKNGQFNSPFKLRPSFKKPKNILKSNLPLLGNSNDNNDNKATLLSNRNINANVNLNENINNNGNLSHHSSKKRSMSEFKNKILQTINNNNLFHNKNNMMNNMKHFNPPNIKNINTQNSAADSENPVKKSKIKSLNRKNRNISSYEIGNFPLIVD